MKKLALALLSFPLFATAVETAAVALPAQENEMTSTGTNMGTGTAAGTGTVEASADGAITAPQSGTSTWIDPWDPGPSPVFPTMPRNRTYSNPDGPTAGAVEAPDPDGGENTGGGIGTGQAPDCTPTDRDLGRC